MKKELHICLAQFIKYEGNALLANVYLGDGVFEERQFDGWLYGHLFPLPFKPNRLFIGIEIGRGYQTIKFENANRYYKLFSKVFN